MNFIQQRISASQVLQYFNPETPEKALILVEEYNGLLDDETQPFETRKMPTLRETIFSTIRLKNEFHKFLEVIQDLHEGVVLGGSMSYGPFLVVREDSDLDIIVLSQYPQKVLTALDRQIMPLAASRNETLDSAAGIVSHKGDTLNGVNISCHIIHPQSLEDWRQHLNQDVNCTQDKVLPILDSKNLAFSWPNFRQRGFDGSTHTFPANVHTEPFLYHSFVYAIDNRHLYPGMYLNLISAPALCFFMTPQCLESITEIRQLLQDRLEYERVLRPDSQLLKAHLRWEVISKTSPYIN